MSLKIIKLVAPLLLFSTLNGAGQSLSNPADTTKMGDAEILNKITLKSPLASAPVFCNNDIYAAEKTGIVTCFDSAAVLQWKVNLGILITTQPFICDDVVVLGTVAGDIIILKRKTGEQIQSMGLDKAVTTSISSFDYNGNIELAMPKSNGSKSAILFGTEDGKIHCYDLETLQEYWTNSDSKGTVRERPVIVENKILFSSSDGYIYCIGSDNGLLIWRWKETAQSSFFDSNIITDGKTVFAVSNDKSLFAIDLLLGKLVWKSKNIPMIPVIGLSRDKKDLFAETGDRRVLVMSASLGKILRTVKVDLPFDTTGVPVIEREEKLYFTRGGTIYSIDNKSVVEPVISSGGGPINLILQTGEKRFLFSDITGTIIIFKLR